MHRGASTLRRSCVLGSLAASAAVRCEARRTVDRDELAQNDYTPVCDGGTGRLWVSYKKGVYDVTALLETHAHPGGQENLLAAAGGAVDPHWAYWRGHVQTGTGPALLEPYRIGDLAAEEDEDALEDPYEDEPDRAARIRRGLRPLGPGVGPFEAECDVAGESFVTPADVFYVRNHGPTPPAESKEFPLFVGETRVDVESRATKGCERLTFEGSLYLSSLSCPYSSVSRADTVGTEVIISLQGLER